jgi:hypothetical protein
MKRCLVAFVLLVAANGWTAPQRWPFAFDPAIAADPTGTQNQINSGMAGLPLLPVSQMVTLQPDQVTLWFLPDAAALLQAINKLPATPPLLSWPRATTLCPQHTTFAVPASLLLPNPSADCQSADSTIRSQLANLAACLDVEQPERYVLGYQPAVVDSTVTGSIEGWIGVSGEALSHTDFPDGVLPADFVTKLRAVVAKLRHDPLEQELAAAQGRYAQALATANAHSACFDPGALATLTTGVTALQNELTAVKAWLDQLDASGQAAVAHELQCLAGHSRTRPTLPFPSVTAAEREFVAFWLGGLTWRMRGGWLPRGMTQTARIDFVLDFYLTLGNFLGGKDGSDQATPIYLPLLLVGWSDWMDMGTSQPGADKYSDLVSMTNRGNQQVATAASNLAMKNYDSTVLTAGGLDMGPCYYYSWWANGTFRISPTMPMPYGGFIDGQTAMGEFCTGGSIALGLAKTLLPGAPTGQPPTVDLCAGKTCGDDGCGGSCGPPCPDAGTATDGAVDQGEMPAADASSNPPVGGGGGNPATPGGSSGSGCGCAAGARPPTGGAGLFLVLLVLALRATSFSRPGSCRPSNRSGKRRLRP